MVAGAPSGNDLTNLCKSKLGDAQGCYSTTVNNIVGCLYTTKAPIGGKRDSMPEVQEPDVAAPSVNATACVRPSHHFHIADGKKYLLKIDSAEGETYKNMTSGPEKNEFIKQNAHKIKDATS